MNVLDDLAVDGDVDDLLLRAEHAEFAETDVKGARRELAIGVLRHDNIYSTRESGWVEVVVGIADITAKALYIIHFSNFLKETTFISDCLKIYIVIGNWNVYSGQEKREYGRGYALCLKIMGPYAELAFFQRLKIFS